MCNLTLFSNKGLAASYRHCMVTYPSSNGPQPILYNYFWICLSALMDICFWCELRCPESQKGTIAQCIHLRRLCPAPFPSPRVPGTSPQSFIQSLQGRIYHPSIQSVIHSFPPPGIHVNINHSLPIWHITASLTLLGLFVRRWAVDRF